MTASTGIDGTPSRRRGRGTLAVLAGLVLNVVLGLGIDAILHATGVFPPWGQAMDDRLFALAAAYRIAIGIASGWLVARLAPDRPVKHAVILGVIGTIISAAGAAATWNRGAEFGPHWYPVLLTLSAIP
ncbi:MAG TPA: hypothetical protein VHM30_10000, partial [Gemmatimonadaceae bacterium]|nr:hypothetical protein [Gemmatimonadaceae bacterium]